jgi:hypothetical protein
MEGSQKWKENKAIGDMVEKIVEFLINSTPNWECIPYGMENHIEELRKQLKDKLDDTSRRIKSMPDFIALNKKTGETLLIDVKYRSFIDKRDNKNALYGFSYGQIKDYLEFWKDVKLIVVHNYEPYFIVIDMKDVEWHKHFHSRKYIDNNSMIEQWNFGGIQKGIKSLFSELPDDVIKRARAMIPNNK